MAVIIEPISINSNGDVLCKTSHYLNKEGAHMQMPLTYSFLVIHADRSITEYDWFYLNTLGRYDWDAIEQELEKWDKIFEETSLENMPVDVLDRIKEYNFLNTQMEQYAFNRIVSSAQLSEEFGIPATDPQITIDSHHSDSSFSKVYVKYDFPHFILTRNRFNVNTVKKTGAEFDYYYTHPSVKGNIGYEIYTIDAFMFR